MTKYTSYDVCKTALLKKGVPPNVVHSILRGIDIDLWFQMVVKQDVPWQVVMNIMGDGSPKNSHR